MLMKKIEDAIFYGPSRNAIRHVERPDYENAGGLKKQVLDQMQREFQIVPPVTLHFSNSSLMAASWTLSREALIAGPTSRTHREVVAAVTSQLNECPFCVDVHVSMLHGSGNSIDVVGTLNGDKDDPDTKALIDWAQATLTPDANVLDRPPFSTDDAPYLICTALGFHYTNRMVNIFLDASPIPVNVSNTWVKDLIRKTIGVLAGKRMVSIRATPGETVFSLKDAPLPNEFDWAMGNEAITTALATFADVAQKAGQDSLSNEARQAVLNAVNAWHGQQMPTHRGWIDETITGLSEEDRSGAELALLSALASYRITDDLVARFRLYQPDDRDLINVTAWGAFAATLRISSWIAGNQRAS
jgi:AhpD family alkylhydroperoxidase